MVDMYSVICKKCGKKVRGPTKSVLTTNMTRHFEQDHSTDIPQEVLDDIEKMVRRRMDEGLY